MYYFNQQCFQALIPTRVQRKEDNKIFKIKEYDKANFYFDEIEGCLYLSSKTGFNKRWSLSCKNKEVGGFFFVKIGF